MARLIAFILLLAAPAQAHDWYSKHQNPVSKAHCCGLNDCKPVPASDIRMIYNHYIYLPKNLSISRREALESPDHNFHVCEYPTYSLERRLRCIFVPPAPGY